MTRETKIGLLVGLAFIIVIGILLSDHLTSSTEPPPAQLAPAGSVVRAGVTTPGGAQPRMAQVVAPRVQPQNTVPTARDVQQPTAPAAVVRVGGPSGQDQAQPDSQPAPPITFVTNPTPGQPMQQPGLDPAHAALAQVAQQNGESIVSATRDPGRQVVVAAAAPGFKDYVAQPGDSLSKIASQQMGSKNQANQDAIVRANPSLTSNPNLIIAGKTYKIPVTAAAPSESAPVAAIATSPARETASATDFWYTVKDGDTLWGIANEQLGGPSGVTAIKELNRDLLKDSDTIRVNMKLRLPGRPIARVN